MQIWYYFFLKCLMEFTTEAVWVWSFLCGEAFGFVLFSISWIYKALQLFLLLEWIMSFKEFVHFTQVAKFIGRKLFIIFPYYPFNIYRICGDVTTLIPNNGNLCLLSFFSISLARGLSILLIFSKTQLLGSLLFSLVLCLLFHLINDIPFFHLLWI